MLELVTALNDARRRTLDLVEDLGDEQLLGEKRRTVNPLLWELGHVGWFQEKWMLRRIGEASVRSDADALYDSAAVPHDVRWDLPLHSRPATAAYLEEVRERVAERLTIDPRPADEYFARLVLFHEDMHGESFLATRQTHGYAAPAALAGPSAAPRAATRAKEDVRVPGGSFRLGAAEDEPFVFDNEKWAHCVPLGAFAISRDAVTQGEFAEFVEDGGYRRAELWDDGGRRWREARSAEHPVYWRRGGDGWERRRFDAWVPLEPELAMVHVSWHEAEAYCRWAGRRLPTEAEWEAAAAAEIGSEVALDDGKRRFPWGDTTPGEEHAHLDARALDCVAPSALPASDSASGCRQMIGNVWEWTSSDFTPYPGFVRDPYAEYSEPWFGTHKVLRGGCYATRARLLRNTWRNFFLPGRRDVFAGFRTCARSDD